MARVILQNVISVVAKDGGQEDKEPLKDTVAVYPARGG